jgi:peptidyl-prolyl cis-trans isomerase C
VQRGNVAKITTWYAAIVAGAWVLAPPPVGASETPAARIPATEPNANPLTPRPAETMAAMARELDRNGDTVVLMIEKVPITQADMADLVRTMPTSFANLGFAEVSKRALDILVGQKAMALDARKEGMDKDPVVARLQNTATDRVLADAWLTRHVKAAVTDKALQDRYDRDIAGRPGPDEVRARVILLPTDTEARAVIAKAQAGEEFPALARGFSKAPNAANGGDLGYAAIDALAPEIAPVIFALAPGQVSAYPVPSPAGWFVIRVEGRRQRATPSFEDSRPGLERVLQAEAAETTIQSVLQHIKVVPTEKPAAK